MARKGLRRSRNGCLQCKRRSVKCDERRPSCTHCQNRLESCQYADASPRLWTQSNAETHGHGLSRTSTVAVEPGEIAPTPSPAPSLPQYQPSGSGQFSLLHLRLLLNWTTSTCQSISRNETDLRIWQAIVPRMALSHPFLLHGIFAVSALHLSLPMARQNPDRDELIKAAEYHQSEAIKIFTPTIGNLTPSQYDATFALSNLLVSIALTFPLVHSSVTGGIPHVLDEFIQVFAFVRKTTEFSSCIMESVKGGEIGQLTLLEPTRARLSEPIQSRLSTLHRLITAHILDPNYRHAFQDTIDGLANIFARMYSRQEIFSASFLWMAQTPALYFNQLRDRDPLALVILAHDCIVLHHMSQHWWIQSWGRQVLEAIRTALGPSWRGHIAWPLEAIGL